MKSKYWILVKICQFQFRKNRIWLWESPENRPIFVHNKNMLYILGENIQNRDIRGLKESDNLKFGGLKKGF